MIKERLLINNWSSQRLGKGNLSHIRRKKRQVIISTSWGEDKKEEALRTYERPDVGQRENKKYSTPFFNAFQLYLFVIYLPLTLAHTEMLKPDFP